MRLSQYTYYMYIQVKLLQGYQEPLLYSAPDEWATAQSCWQHCNGTVACDPGTSFCHGNVSG